VLGALDPLADGQQGGELIPCPGRIPRLPGPAGELVAGGQGVRVLGALDPLADGQQGGALVAGPGRIPRLPGPAGELVWSCVVQSAWYAVPQTAIQAGVMLGFIRNRFVGSY
jgi:hypothetical protein